MNLNEKKLKVLFISPSCFYKRGGVEAHLREISKELLNDGHVVTIISMSSIVLEKKLANVDGIRVFTLSIGQSRIKNFVIVNLYLFLKLKEFYSADIIHYHDYKVLCHWSVLIYPILVLLRKKIYITFHGWEGQVPPDPVVKLQRKCAEKIVNGNICIGHFISKWYGTNPSIVSYGGVRIPRVVGRESNNVLFIGRLEQDSGIVNYIQAWSDVQEHYRWMSLIVCGEGALKPFLNEYIKENKLNNIRFIGSVEDPQSYMVNCRIVFASGYLSILDAFACKKPVISFYNSEIKKDYLEMMPFNHKMMWITKNSAEVVNSIAEALTDNEKVNRAYEFALRNSWEAVKLSYYQLWSLH